MTTAAQMLGDHLARAFQLLGGQPVQFDALGRVRAPFTPEPLPMFKLEIQTENAAFEGPDCAEELARILEKLAKQLRSDGFSGSTILLDINGNRCGEYAFSGEVTQ